jgi:hypothetical protein
MLNRSRARFFVVLSLMVLSALPSIVAPAAAGADPDPRLPYGPNTCANGLVWRAARPGDAVCVPSSDRDRTAKENATAAERVDPKGAYGPQSCKSGFVWRQAFDGDAVCVTPDTRRENLDWNTYKCGLESELIHEQAIGGMYCLPPPPEPQDLGNYPGYLS